MRCFPAKVFVPFLFLFAMLSAGAAADDVTLSGVIAFNSLDGSADDHDGAADGTFTVNDGNLVLDGTIQCNDDPPLPGSGSACPIRLSVSGDLILNPGSAILAENRRGGGNGGTIDLEVEGALVLHGLSGALPGSLISSSRTSGASGTAGSISATVGGGVEMEKGSIVAAGNPSGQSGAIEIEAGGRIQIAGLIASGPGRNLLASRWNGVVLNGGSSGQKGGSVVLRSTSPEEPGIRIETTGVVASQSESFGMQLVLLESCGIEVRGLVAAVTKGEGATRVALRSSKGILVDGQGLAGAGGSGRGRIRSDSTRRGTAGYLVDLFAQGDIQVLGPVPGSTDLFVVSANPGDQPSPARGTVTAISLAGSMAAHGNAFESGRWRPGDKGGMINLASAGDMDLNGAHLRAIGDYSTSSSARQGGQIAVRSYQGEVAWTFGKGDVRPTGSAVPPANRGTISITACTGIDVTGTLFPVQGSPVAPFPVESDGVCSPSAPSLPAGEPALPVCGQAPLANDQSVTTDEDVPVTITLTGSDPDGDSLTFSVVSGPAHGTLGSLTPLTPTSAQVVYTPGTDYSGSDSFTFQVDDGNGGTATGVVSITVNDAAEVPTAVDDTATVAEDSGANSIDVLANDTDPNGVGKTIESVTQPAHGTVEILPGGTGLTYQPNANYCGSDSFTYTLNGGSSATVLVSVTCVNDAPLLGDQEIEYTTLGNTQLRVGEDTDGNSVFHLRDNSDVDEKASPSDVETPGTVTVVPFSGNTGKGGLELNADGTFTYEPNPGFEGTDVITFTVTDNGTPAATTTGTMTITVVNTIWYVHDVTGEDNPEPDDTGRSTNAFENLEDVASVLTDNDYVYVFKGNSDTNPHGGIRINKTGVKLIGAGADLIIPGFGILIPAADVSPRIVNTIDVPSEEDNGVTVDATTASLSGIEVQGFDISGRDNGIDVTAAGANSVEVTISNNRIASDGSTGQEGLDINANSTGTTTVTVANNSLSGRGNAFDARLTAAGALQIDLSNNKDLLSVLGSGIVIDGSGGIATITGFAGNTVDANTPGTGISVTGATFDQAPGGTFQAVNGGNTGIGAAGNGVGGAGMVLTNVQGAMNFTNLQVFADNGAGLRASSPTTYTGSSGLQLVVSSPDLAIVEATGGPAVDISTATINLPLASLESTNSPTTGLALNGVAGTFSAGAESSISNIASAAGTAFQVGGSSATVTYDGTVTTNQGTGVALTNNSGTIGFKGTLTLSTGPNPAFLATGGGTVTATDSASTLATTTTTALNVTNTTIGASGLKFRSISSNGGGNSGIVLTNTGSSGGLTVSGTGGAGSGGTIQNKTIHGVSLNNTRGVSLSSMVIDNNDGSGVWGDDVTNFSINGSSITNSGDTQDGSEAGLRFNELLGSSSITNTTISGSSEDNIRLTPTSGVLTNLVISNSIIGSCAAPVACNGFTLVATGSADVTVTVAGSTFQSNKSSAFLTSGDNTARQTINISSSTFQDNNVGVDLAHGGSGDFTFNVSNNVAFLRHASDAIRAGTGDTTTNAMQVVGTVSGNTIGNGALDSGSRDAQGIDIDIRGDADAIISITGNTVSNTDIEGIRVQGRLDDQDGPDAEKGRLDLTLRDNVVNTPDDNSEFPFGSVYGLLVEARNTYTLCMDIAGNDSASVGSFEHIRVRQRDSSVFLLERLTDGDGTPNEVLNTVATIESHVASQNVPGSTADATLTAGFTETANGTCRKP